MGLPLTSSSEEWILHVGFRYPRSLMGMLPNVGSTQRRMRWTRPLPRHGARTQNTQPAMARAAKSGETATLRSFSVLRSSIQNAADQLIRELEVRANVVLASKASATIRSNNA